MVVLGSVGLGPWVNEWVHFDTYPEDVEVEEAEDVEFYHNWGCVRPWWAVF